MFKVYLDLSRCCLKQLKSPQAITFCKKMLKLKPNCTRAFIRMRQAYCQIGKFEKAEIYLIIIRGLALVCKDEEIERELLKFENIMKKLNLFFTS